uniref:Solute carrier family 5 member 8 n=1 Tax=Varanus komodoensis TaxID=61221 RepID=A0A8D2Q1C3_VARKO
MSSTSPAAPHHPDAAELAERFTAFDYLVFAGMLLLSAAIGIFYAFRGVYKSATDFMMGGRNLTFGPVSLSLTASFMSAVTVLGTPAEIYRFGISFGLFAFAYIFMVVISAEVFVPVYYRLGITSTYELLFHFKINSVMQIIPRGTIYFTCIFFVPPLQILYTGIVIYSPSLALNQVTGFQLWGSVLATGIVCTFYCTLGGLKAVVWTDVFQFVLMISGFIAVIARTVVIKGGFGPIIDDARHGGRLHMWDLNPSPLQRHTVWTVIIGGTFTWLGIYGVNQSQVQRYLACKSLLHAKLSLYMNLVGLWITLSSAVMCGLSMYSVYKNCDPWTSKYVLAPDQLMPYLVLDILGDFPGIPGLFVAGTYSGTLSTVSSSINALAAVTVEDFIKPNFEVTESRLSWISMGMSKFVLCLFMAAVASVMGALLQAALSVFGIIGGPLLGIFSLGILLPFANAKGAFSGLLCGFFCVMWIGIGSQKYPPPPHRTLPLPLSTEGCLRPNVTIPTEVTTTMLPPSLILRKYNLFSRSPIQDYWYSLSYLYFSMLGTLITFIVGSSCPVQIAGPDPGTAVNNSSQPTSSISS